VSIAYSMSMTESTEPKPIVPKFITSKITEKKLNGDNYYNGGKFVETNLTGDKKKSYAHESS